MRGLYDEAFGWRLGEPPTTVNTVLLCHPGISQRDAWGRTLAHLLHAHRSAKMRAVP
jgi:hypothetical protein